MPMYNAKGEDLTVISPMPGECVILAFGDGDIGVWPVRCADGSLRGFCLFPTSPGEVGRLTSEAYSRRPEDTVVEILFDNLDTARKLLAYMQARLAETV